MPGDDGLACVARRRDPGPGRRGSGQPAQPDGRGIIIARLAGLEPLLDGPGELGLPGVMGGMPVDVPVGPHTATVAAENPDTQLNRGVKLSGGLVLVLAVGEQDRVPERILARRKEFTCQSQPPSDRGPVVRAQAVHRALGGRPGARSPTAASQGSDASQQPYMII
jgi:hypothetical protein